MPKVSVIIPVYNTEKYLKECLESLQNQTLEDFEAICINDGSTDSSLEILKDFASKDSRFTIIDKQNEGQGIARNIGIQKAQGEYLICIDSDDWLEKDGLEKAYNKIKVDGSDILFFDYYRYSKNTKTVIKYTSPYDYWGNNTFSPTECGIKLFCTNGLTCKMYRNHFLKKNNIKYSEHKFIEDVPFYIRAMLKAGKISCLKEPIYNYRILKTGHTHNWKNYFTCIPEVYNICFDIIQNCDKNQDILNSFLRNRKQSLLYFYHLTPLPQKSKYYKMMQEIIKKHFLKYNFDEELKEIISKSFFEYEILSKINKTKIILETHAGL